LTLKSGDELALDTLANSKAIKLHLVRSIALGSDAMEEKAERRSNTFFPSSAGQGYFWPSMEGAKETGTRIMRGELEVKKGIKPSFHFPRFTVRASAAGFSAYHCKFIQRILLVLSGSPALRYHRLRLTWD
jgi:hypothetical protein